MLLSSLRSLIAFLGGEPVMALLHQWVFRQVEQELYVQNLLQQERYREPKRLLQAEGQCFSQHGQDGILSEIFRRIGTTSRFFIELGSGNGLENNTAYLLLTGWQGRWWEGSARAVAQARKTFASVLGKELRIEQAQLSRKNVASLLAAQAVPVEFDLLSLDIDRNTYYLWEALAEYRPRVVVVEYNSSILPRDDWKVEDNPAKSWNGTTYFGASLKAYELLGARLGYCLVGCDLTGTDAFFVRQDLVADHFCAPYSAENHYEPPRYFLKRRQGHVAGWEG